MHTKEIKKFKGLLYDKYFKVFFKYEEALKSFINSYFQYQGIEKNYGFADIKIQELIPPNKDNLKHFYADVVCTLTNGEIIIIEAYTSFNLREYKKSNNYMYRSYSNQLLEGDILYENSHKVTCIFLMKGNYENINNTLVNGYTPKNNLTNKIIEDGETKACFNKA